MSSSSKKRCQIGKGCGASCIKRSKICQIDLNQHASKATGKVRNSVKPSNPSGGTAYARGDADDFDKNLKTKPISLRVGDPNYDWERSKGSGSKVLGEGDFGSVLKEGGGNAVVKRGEIGKEEVAIAEKLAKHDLGPKPLAAEIDGDGQEKGFKVGRLAMTLIPGEPIGNRSPDDEIGGQKVADSFWKARADVHRLGIAHNDMHTDNLLIDSNGKGRFVDMGLSQGFPKAALAEALGIFAHPTAEPSRQKQKVSGADGDGDWQVMQWMGTGGAAFRNSWGAKGWESGGEETMSRLAPLLTRVANNYPAVVDQLKKDGFSSQEIQTIVVHGLRSPEITYQKGPWAKMTDAQAMKYIDLLYQGV